MKSPAYGILTPYQWDIEPSIQVYIKPPTQDIVTPIHDIFNPLIMVYRTPLHGILNAYLWYIYPPLMIF